MRPVVFFIAISLLLVLSFCTISLYSSEVINNKWEYTFHPRKIIRKFKVLSNSLRNKNSTQDSACILTKLDPFGDGVWEYMDPMLGENHRKTCNKQFVARTTLEKRELRQLDEKDFCWGRCLHYEFATEYYGKDSWVSAKNNPIFECDIVESICSRTNDRDAADYGYLHTQIHEIEENQRISANKSTSEKKKYNVLLLILDSTSSSMAARNLPLTMEYLKKEMGGVEFKYLNRVGRNSKPNAAALLLGKRAEPVTQFDNESPKWDYNLLDLEEHCETDMDVHPTIYKNFSDEGYVTFLSEDLMIPVFSYFTCKGYQKPMADHTSHPYSSAWEIGSQTMKDTFTADNCDDKHARLINYTEQFLRSYKGIPKFGTYWDTEWAHEVQSTLVPADIVLHRLFKQNREYLKDTFVFITGDHGPRFGNFVKTKVGALELDNPMLIVVPPEELQNNEELMDTLRENSEKLQTHWDTRATLLDILKHQPSSDFWDGNPLDISPDGSSMLRRQEGERSCRTLPIPIEYCLCRYPTEQKNINSNEARYFAQEVIATVEKQLTGHGVANLCNKWTIKDVLELKEILPTNAKKLYHITIALKKPRGAQFKSMVSEVNGTLSVGSVDRLDSYKDRGKCVADHLARLCDCL